MSTIFVKFSVETEVERWKKKKIEEEEEEDQLSQRNNCETDEKKRRNCSFSANSDLLKQSSLFNGFIY